MTGSRMAVAAAAVLVAGHAAQADEAWTASGFDAPESVLHDAGRDVFYVSSIGGAPDARDGNGRIATLAPDGSVQDAEWVGGLDAPKGLAMQGDTLYVSDIDRLVAIDLGSGEISGRWPAEGAQFLNDIAIDGDGRVFVSDMVANRIYVLDGDAVSVWLEDEGLMHPNGLSVQDGQLIVAAWGRGMQPDMTTEQPGHLLTVDLETKVIAPLGSGAGVGNLDGLEPDGAGGWLATDWVGGGLHRIQPDGTSERLLDLDQGSADLEYLPDGKLAVIPMMMDGTVVAHRLDQPPG